MSRTLRWILWTTSAVSTATGLAFVAMRELLDRSDPFSAYNHPLQPWALAAHVLVVPLLVFALGWTWAAHVAPRLAEGRRTGRATGLAGLLLGAVMIASGYALQVVAHETVRLALAWTHGLSGALFAACLTGHALAGLRRRRLEGVAAGLRPRAGTPTIAKPARIEPTPASRRDAAPRPGEASGSR